ncbi:MAG: tRNA epoxyqueuosine(34) reductase QueG [Candidatus Hydrogenedentes bacterium]|nr:tRNA epoxyqueuosine(34) reductase QueG [Candidatus Hydrogenedentota bacterium]
MNVSQHRTHTTEIKARARELGFDACGIATADDADPQDLLGTWLSKGFHADMHWMHRSRHLRQDVSLKLPGAKSVIVLARNYYSPRPKQRPGTGKVATYAWGRDYHRVLKKPLRRLAGFINDSIPSSESYCSVDSGPVLERTWAARAGVGAIGKNSLVLRRDLGSWFFLGTIITTAELVPDAPVNDLCGTCTRCIDACPTAAIVEPYVVDSRKCISYHTIENRGDVSKELSPHFEDWIFGCDICQEVCPWNRFARITSEPDFLPRAGNANLDPDEILREDEAAFNARFEGTPIRRAKYTGMVRNAITVKNNDAREDRAVDQSSGSPETAGSGFCESAVVNKSTIS